MFINTSNFLLPWAHSTYVPVWCRVENFTSQFPRWMSEEEKEEKGAMQFISYGRQYHIYFIVARPCFARVDKEIKKK